MKLELTDKEDILRYLDNFKKVWAEINEIKKDHTEIKKDQAEIKKSVKNLKLLRDDKT